jgi:hypothetical protein
VAGSAQGVGCADAAERSRDLAAEDTLATRRLIGRYIDVWEYPDARLEIRADGVVLPCVPYDRLAEIDQGAVIEHKRLGHALQVAQAMQAQRDNRRIAGSPSRTNRGAAVRKPKSSHPTKKQRAFTQADLNQAIVQIALQSKMPSTPGQRSARTPERTDTPCPFKAVLRHYVDSNR